MYNPGFFSFNRKLWDYNDETTEKIIEKLMDYDADYGGTDILKPLKEAVKLDVDKRQKRIFLLTDGQDS